MQILERIMGGTESRETVETAISRSSGEDSSDEGEQAYNFSEPEEQVSEDDVAEAEEWARNSQPKVRLMVCGKTGTGKSTLLNGIVGAYVFEEGDDFDPQTLEIESKQLTKAGVDIVVFDTPGLQDGSGNEGQYLEKMREECTDIHLIVYCISMMEPRTDLKRSNSAIKVITRGLGVNIWENAVIVLTYANIFEGRLKTKYGGNNFQINASFKSTAKEWKKSVINALKESGVPRKIYNKINVVPASTDSEPHLLTQRYWLSNFWSESLLAMNKDAQVAMIKMSVDRLQDEADIRPEDFDCDITNQRLVMTKLNKGVAVGGAGAGFVAGATTGALIGTFTIGVVSFGVAAGVGMALGAIIGGGIGASGGGGIGLLIALYRRNKKQRRMEAIRKQAFKEIGNNLAS